MYRLFCSGKNGKENFWQKRRMTDAKTTIGKKNKSTIDDIEMQIKRR